MIPFGLTEEQFISRYRRWLDSASSRLIDELRALFASPLPSTVTSGEVELFLADDGRDDPGAWLYFDGMNKRVDHDDPSIFPGRALEIPLGLDMMPSFDGRYFESDEFPGVDLQACALKAWFAECWWKAGGWAYPLPVQVAIHDNFGDGEITILTEKCQLTSA